MYMTDRPATDLSFRKFQMAISPQLVVRSSSSLVLGWGFRGRRIEWRYICQRHVWPIYFAFGDNITSHHC